MRYQIFKLKLIVILTISIYLNATQAFSKETTSVETLSNLNNLINQKIGYLNFIPLPPNYPKNYFPLERVFTEELFAKNPQTPINETDIIFVPKDYLNIIERTFLNTLATSHLKVQKLTSMNDAIKKNVSLVIIAAPTRFQVNRMTEAVVVIQYQVYDSSGNKVLWENEIASSFNRGGLPSSLKDTEVFILGKHQFNFQPQRAILAMAVYKNFLDFITQLNKTLNK
jgi:hypothetical protein